MSANVLIVEDNDHELALALRALKAAGLAVEVVRDGVEALDRLLPPTGSAPAPPPDFILLDLKLPRIGGLEVARRLKDDPRTRVIPVVVFSSAAEPSELTLCYQAGINSYIVKPVDFARLISVIQEVGHYWSQLNRVDA